MIRKMFQKKFISKKYYQALFTAAFSVLILLSFLLSYLISSLYIAQSDRKTLQAANHYLEDAMTSCRELTSQIDVLYGFLSANHPAVTEYLTRKETDDMPDPEVMNTLKNIGLLNPNISSVILYNHVNETYLSSDPSFDMQLFLKTFLTNSIENLPAQARNKAMFAYRDQRHEEESGKPVYLSMVYYILNKYTQTYYSIVFNLDAFQVGNGIFDDPAETFSPETIFLVNEFGSVAASCGLEHTRQNIPFSWIKRASAGTSDGTFTGMIDGREYLVTYRKMDTADWYCFAVNQSRKDLFHSPSLLILLSTVSILISLGLTFFLARKLYSPIHYAMTELDQIAGISEIGSTEEIKSKNDEFAYVSSVVLALSDKVQNLKQENTSNLEILRKSFLRTLISENGAATDLEKAWKAYDIPLFGPEIYLLLAAIDPKADERANRELPFTQILSAGLESCLADLCTLELIPKGDDQFVVLYTPKTGGTQYRLPVERLVKLQEFVSFSAHVSLTLIVEGNCYPAARIYEGYKNALRLLKERFVLGYGQIISGKETACGASLLPAYPDDSVKEILDTIRQRDREAFIRCYDRLTGCLEQYRYQDVIRVLIHLIDQMTDIMRSITTDHQYLYMDFSSVDELFHSVHTLRETKEWFLQLFDQYLKALQDCNLNKNDIYWEIVKQAQASIQKNFGDPNLSIESISEAVGYSSNYFSKIFKGLTGVYLKDYIKNVRISHAVSLLTQTDLTVNEISNRTGFVTQNYFFAAFKKETGMTPAAYRKQHGRKDTAGSY